ncbi:pullulanase [Aeromonas simiae]|uniref:Pullulanase n=1 Tax=Aeromonas simiae TaxID=218936 RepID=A0A5J6WVU1_9GAMM|nr:pullulanase [Aeromonas simiae]MDO2948470.1 pullulanase [Aeromonas simiae]MDO2951863.1 pullulanase [Aeromonas simiae]MDO2955853.1 pullulanase [Aeromonas simiae]QFI53435.1 pullulanase [Aeromonas simiae]
MFKKTVAMILAAGTLVLGGCSAGGGADASGDFDGKSVFLRGEMNDWQANDETKVTKVGDKLYMAKGTLKKEWAPYKFKFGDANWSCGTNFGYKSPSDGVASLDGEPVPVNPCSKFEDLKFSPDADGVYEFYLDLNGEQPTVYVKKP